MSSHGFRDRGEAGEVEASVREYKYLELLFAHESRNLFAEPLKRRPLSELSGDEDVVVPLDNGSQLLISRHEVRALKLRVPKYLHAKLTLPLHLKLISTRPLKLKIAGDLWQRRVIWYLLRGELRWEVEDTVSESEFVRLLREFPTALHLSLER
ncbi:MAG: DUF61 family protein [Fervidicoccaceae archaeon]